MTAMNDSIRKADRRGRFHYTEEQKSAMGEAYRSSGLSGPRFAAMYGVNYQTLASWLGKRKGTVPFAPAGTPAPRFLSLIRAEIEGFRSPAGMTPMEIQLPGGAKLTITASTHVRLAATLIREIEKGTAMLSFSGSLKVFVLTRLPARKASEITTLIPANWLKACGGKAARKIDRDRSSHKPRQYDGHAVAVATASVWRNRPRLRSNLLSHNMHIASDLKNLPRVAKIGVRSYRAGCGAGVEPMISSTKLEAPSTSVMVQSI